MRQFVASFVLLALALLTGACSTSLVQEVSFDHLVGQPEAMVISRLGQPTREAASGGQTVLFYDKQKTVQKTYTGPISPYGFYGSNLPDSARLGAPDIIDKVCHTTFTIIGGRVASWSAHGNGCGVIT